MFAKLIHIRHVNRDLWMGTGIKGDNAAVAVVGFGSHTAHMRPDESKQVLLQLHFEFRWIVGSYFLCAVDLLRLHWAFCGREKVRNVTFAHTVRIFSGGVVNRQQRSPGTDWVALTKCAGSTDWMACATMKHKSVWERVSDTVCENIGKGT